MESDKVEVMSERTSVCAVVVTYYPDAGLKDRLESLLSQVEALVVVDNTPGESLQRPVKVLLPEGPGVFVVENRRNLGVAAALNQGLEKALKLGCDWLLTLDQDSRCYTDMVQTLLSVKAACMPAAAVIGGNYLDTPNDRTKVPVGGAADFLEQKTVITSGSLIDTRMAAEIGGFRDDYFIDQVDHEFCLRARAHGYQIVISRKVVMTHSVGRPGGVRIPLMGTLPNHPPLRKYYIARNTVVTVAEYWNREPQWCLRRMMRLLLGLGLMAFLEEQRMDKVRAFAGGVADGLNRRMGPCARESICCTLPYAP